MGRKLNDVDKFYIEGHMATLSVNDLAKTLGCTTKTIQNHINKLKGRSREVSSLPTNAPSADTPAMQVTEPVREKAVRIDHQETPPTNSSGIRLDALLAKRAGSTSMTQAASEVGDDIAAGRIGNTRNPFDDPERVHRIKK
jgi:hypothetical protein